MRQAIAVPPAVAVSRAVATPGNLPAQRPGLGRVRGGDAVGVAPEPVRFGEDLLGGAVGVEDPEPIVDDDEAIAQPVERAGGRRTLDLQRAEPAMKLDGACDVRRERREQVGFGSREIADRPGAVHRQQRRMHVFGERHDGRGAFHAVRLDEVPEHILPRVLGAPHDHVRDEDGAGCRDGHSALHERVPVPLFLVEEAEVLRGDPRCKRRVGRGARVVGVQGANARPHGISHRVERLGPRLRVDGGVEDEANEIGELLQAVQRLLPEQPQPKNKPVEVRGLEATTGHLIKFR
jgi:hypothetical protein